MKIIHKNYTHDYKTSFKAKFLHSESLRQIAEYAVEHGKFEKLNQARKNIDQTYLLTRLRVDVGESEKGRPFVTFTKFVPKSKVLVPKTMDDYKMTNITLIDSDKNKNILKFALEKIIKMGNNAPENNLFKKIVIGKK